MAFCGITVNSISQNQKLNTWLVSVFAGDRYFCENERNNFTHIPGLDVPKGGLISDFFTLT